MTLTASFLLFFLLVWRGASALALALVGIGVMIQLVLSLQILRATVGGVGGHAEWVRDVSLRPRMLKSPAWLISLALILAGAAVALW
jgi:hypothetical protein